MAIILALTYVPTERCPYVSGSKRCVASKWQFFFDMSGQYQVDTDRLIIQVVVVLVAIVGLWLLVVRDNIRSGRDVHESVNGQAARPTTNHSTAAQSVTEVKADAWGARGALQEATVFKPKERREPLLVRMLTGAIGGALVLGGASIPVSIGLAIWIAVRGGEGLYFGSYLVLFGFAAIVGGIFGAVAGMTSK